MGHPSLEGQVKRSNSASFPTGAVPSAIILPKSASFRHEFGCAEKEAQKCAHVIVTGRNVHFRGVNSDTGITGFHLSGVEFFTN